MHERTCCEDITVCPVVYLILTLVCHRMGKTATNIDSKNCLLESAVCCYGIVALHCALSYVAV